VARAGTEEEVKRAPVTPVLREPTSGEGEHVCQRCRRPLDPGERTGDYVCCASELLSWHCEGCGKVSEGFAFPWGLCPTCGGKLSVTTPRPAGAVDLEAIRTAFEIELGGQAFYRHAAEQATDETMKTLFGKFAGMEHEHMTTLSRRYHVEVPPPAAGASVDRAALYAGIPRDPEDPVNLFRIAIAFEQKAVEFFHQRVDATPPESPSRTLYTELLAEEQEHVALLTTEMERWKAGKPGLL
jgi:rubrerythrin